MGAMRERVEVQSLTIAVSSAGDRTETWAALWANEPASYDPISGGETLRGRQVDAGVNAIFTVHFRDGYLTTQRLLYGSTTYGILYVNPVDGGRRFIELHCTASG